MKTRVIHQSNHHHSSRSNSKDIDVPLDFDWECYLDLNPDLIRAGLDNKEKAISHWLKFGYKENRSFKKSEISIREPFVTFNKLGYHGKLGNQMFQIAALMGYAKKYKTAYYIPRWTAENGQDLTGIFQGPFNVDPTITAEASKLYLEKSLDYVEIPKKSDHVNLHGFFQNEKYFQNCQEEVVRAFSPFLEVENEIKERNRGLFEKSCSIHVRRGDYIKYSEVHLNLTMAYYDEAIRIMKDKGYSNFLIFSDDLEWCKNNFKNKQGTAYFMFSDRNTANYEDLFLMTFCDSHIIANSTFSWWGAWLGRNPEKVVVSPERWFGPKGPHQHEVVPKNWTRI